MFFSGSGLGGFPEINFSTFTELQTGFRCVGVCWRGYVLGEDGARPLKIRKHPFSVCFVFLLALPPLPRLCFLLLCLVFFVRSEEQHHVFCNIYHVYHLNENIFK